MNLILRTRACTALAVLSASSAFSGCEDASRAVAPVQSVSPNQQLTDAAPGDSITDRYIVILNPTVGNAQTESDRILKKLGGKRKFLYQHIFKGFSVGNLPLGALKALQKDPNVASVER